MSSWSIISDLGYYFSNSIPFVILLAFFNRLTASYAIEKLSGDHCTHTDAQKRTRRINAILLIAISLCAILLTPSYGFAEYHMFSAIAFVMAVFMLKSK